MLIPSTDAQNGPKINKILNEINLNNPDAITPVPKFEPTKSDITPVMDSRIPKFPGVIVII
jgi:hypothetical protein